MARSIGRGIVVVVLFFLVAGCGPSTPSAPRLAPELRLPDVEGRPSALSDYKGKVVLLDFWSTTCETCLHELPMLNTLQEKFGPKGFTVLAVCTDALSTAGLKAFVQENGMAYPVLQSGGGAPPGYGIYGLPQAFLVGRDGFIRKQYMGPKMLEEVTRDAEAALRSTK